MCLFLDDGSYWAEKLLTDINLPPLIPDTDNNSGGSLGLGFRKRWRQVQPKNELISVLCYRTNSMSDCCRFSVRFIFRRVIIRAHGIIERNSVSRRSVGRWLLVGVSLLWAAGWNCCRWKKRLPAEKQLPHLKRRLQRQRNYRKWHNRK